MNYCTLCVKIWFYYGLTTNHKNRLATCAKVYIVYIYVRQLIKKKIKKLPYNWSFGNCINYILFRECLQILPTDNLSYNLWDII